VCLQNVRMEVTDWTVLRRVEVAAHPRVTKPTDSAAVGMDGSLVSATHVIMMIFFYFCIRNN
jgi:hypothetical protein